MTIYEKRKKLAMSRFAEELEGEGYSRGQIDIIESAFGTAYGISLDFVEEIIEAAKAITKFSDTKPEKCNLEMLFFRIKELNQKLKNAGGAMKKPICPYCNSPMKRIKYKGYYEKFEYWKCDCEKGVIPIDEEHEGSYV